MHVWNFPASVPVLMGYYRLDTNVTYNFDFVLFEIVMCGVLYLMAKGILYLKIKKLESANEEARRIFARLSLEPNNVQQNKCLARCLKISDVALDEFDSLLLHLGALQHQATRKVCVQHWPTNLALMKKISAEESFLCLKNAASGFNFDRKVSDPTILGDNESSNTLDEDVRSLYAN